MNVALLKERIAAAVAAGVTSTPALSCTGYVPDSIAEPAFYCGEVDIDPMLSFGADDRVTVTCRVLVSRADDRAGQAALDGYLSRTGASSIRAALEAARGAPGQAALSGACDDLVVRGITGYRLYKVNDTDYYGAEIKVEAIGEGDDG
jgi:hypothetical protein